MIKEQKFIDKIVDIAIICVLGIIAFFSLAPIINTLAVSLSQSAFSSVVSFWPKSFTFHSYNVLFVDIKFWKAFLISIERVVLGGGINVLLTILMAYPLSKEKNEFKMRNIFIWIVIACMLFEPALIPSYLVVRNVGLIDSIWALVLPKAVPVFNVVLLMNFFRGIPKEINEAATIDGAGPWRILFNVYLPISLPSLATITLFSVVFHWNSFFDGLIFLNSAEKYPLQTYIHLLVVQLKSVSLMTPEQIERFSAVSNKTLNAAKIIVSIIPVLAIYPFLQRFFVTGIVMGSVKG